MGGSLILAMYQSAAQNDAGLEADGYSSGVPDSAFPS
jgi:hypothetical protein